MSSPNPNHMVLGSDIIDRIMTFCPDFGTLRSVALVSKEFQNVYRNHPKSITRAVAYNIVGPALPAALRLIRFPLDAHVSTYTDPSAVANECPEDHDASTITAEEQRRLLENAVIVGALEDIFSLRYKSRTARSSVLTAVESERFRRATYRAMLFAKLFPVEDVDFNDVQDMDAEKLARVRKRRAAVLDVYDTRELLELYSFVRFMKGIFMEVAEEHSEEYFDVLLTTGPDGALMAWEDQSDEFLHESIIAYDFIEEPTPFLEGFYSRAFATIWERRKKDPLFATPVKKDPLFIPDGEDEEEEKPLKPPTEDDGGSPARWLLDEVHGENDTCSHCPAPNGLKLLTETNWHRSWLVTSRAPAQLLPGLLHQSASVTQALSALIADKSTAAVAAQTTPEGRGPHKDVEGGAWVGKVFDFAEEMYRGQPTSEFATWSRGDLFCEECFRRFLNEHTWRWLLAERVKGGWVAPEDCWYGFNCRTQRHNQRHDLGKNHLAVPTRG